MLVKLHFRWHGARIRASAQLVGTEKRALLHAAVPPALRYPDSLLLQNLHKLAPDSSRETYRCRASRLQSQVPAQ